jgi:initiation factor 1A
MVKNFGGNKTKRDARKHIVASNENKGELRTIKEDGETYAVVKKVLGGGMCNITCLDGKTRLCIIRNKFKGRGKSGNNAEVGAWILAGIREWEVRKSGEKVCDLLHVYTSNDKEKLLQKNDIDFRALLGTMKEIQEKDGNKQTDVDIEFATESEISYQQLLANRSNNGDADSDQKNVVLMDADFDIDDI